MGLALIPTSRIAEATAHLDSELDRIDIRRPGNADLKERLQKLLNYVYDNWIDGRMFKHIDWCAFWIYVRTNNYLEGFHSHINSRMGSNKKNPKFSDLIDTLHGETEQVALTLAELASGQYKERVNKKAAERNSELEQLWRQFETGRIPDGVALLIAVSEGIGRPDNVFMNFLADPSDLRDTIIEGGDMEVENSA